MRRFLPAVGLLLLCACGQQKKETPPPPAPPQPLRIVATGDVLMHEDVKRCAAARGLDWLFADVAPLFRTADLGFANLETPIAPRTGGPGAPYMFNAPAELAPALKSAGFTVLATANNHAFDQGTKALVETLDHLDAADLRNIGSGRTKGAAEAPLLLDLRGMRVAIFAFTDLFNNNLNRKPEGPWVVAYDPDRSPERVRAARASADVVVVSLHWGNEDQHVPSVRQKEIAAALVGAGVDLILGHHPHVLQPLERVKAGGREGVVAYSLGNFISNQNRVYRPNRQSVAAGDARDGVALAVTFGRTEGGVRIQTVHAEALWTENNWTERQGGKSNDITIRVIQVRAALDAARADLQRLEAQIPPDPKATDALRIRVRMLQARLERVRTILGALEPAWGNALSISPPQG